MISGASQLYAEIDVGHARLKHRVVMAPCTRLRANDAHVHGELARQYYAQRASNKGTLLITEATIIEGRYGGYHNVPGIWSEEQIDGWKQVRYASPIYWMRLIWNFKITDAVHAHGSFIFLQLWALGRAADSKVLEHEGFASGLIAPSPIPLSGKEKNPPRGMTMNEIDECISAHARAAANAVHRAGFDGVEVHGANGYLIDQVRVRVPHKWLNGLFMLVIGSFCKTLAISAPIRMEEALRPAAASRSRWWTRW
jgi:NADPH2 dehydrogenase